MAYRCMLRFVVEQFHEKDAKKRVRLKSETKRKKELQRLRNAIRSAQMEQEGL